MAEIVTHEYRLDDIARDHAINAAVFVPFAILRVHGDRAATDATLEVTIHDVREAGEQRAQLRLWWSAESVPAQPPAVQDRRVTEWAACGVACAVVKVFGGLRMRSVSADGDRFDYWVDDGEREYALEVSGTMTDDVETRHRAKIRQLRENPHGVDGYVVVVGFATRTVQFSFNRFER